MNKIFLVSGLFAVAVAAHAQSFTEGFNDLGMNGDFYDISNLTSRGWYEQNNSTSPSGLGPFSKGDDATFTANSGTGYIAADFNVGNGTISAWLLTPTVALTNGSTFSFYTRTPDNSYPDRLNLYLSTNGSSTNVGSTATSTGVFTTLLTSINPNLGNAYPTSWTQFTVTLAGLPTAGTTGRLGFRYYDDPGGASTANGNYIGIDDVSYRFAPVQSTPEPATFAALGLGVAGFLRRRKRA